MRLGYFKDDFLKHFVRPGSARRAPIINRGQQQPQTENPGAIKGSTRPHPAVSEAVLGAPRGDQVKWQLGWPLPVLMSSSIIVITPAIAVPHPHHFCAPILLTDLSYSQQILQRSVCTLQLDDCIIVKCSIIYHSSNYEISTQEMHSFQAMKSMLAGYYSRTAAIKHLIQQFLLCGGASLEKQILSLGAGFDTTWFHLKVGMTAFYTYTIFGNFQHSTLQLLQHFPTVLRSMCPNICKCNDTAKSRSLNKGSATETEVILGTGRK